MYSINTAAANWNFSAANNKMPTAQSGDAFALMLDAMKKGGASSQDSLLDMLGQRFPGMNFSIGSAGEGAKAAEEVAGNQEGDHVAIESAAAESLLGNSKLMEMLDKALSAFAESAGQTQPAQGAYVQRTVMVAVVSVRVTVSQYSEASGEMLSANEMKTALSEKLEEMIRQFFGKGVAGTENEAADENADAADNSGKTGTGNAAKDADKTGADAGSDWSMAWAAGASFSMYFSGSYVSGFANDQNNAFQMSQVSGSFQFGAQGSFPSFANNAFPYAIFSGLQSSGFGSGPFTSMLNGALDQLGLATDSMWQQDGGYFLKLRESRNLIAELMNLYNKSAADRADAADTASETDAEVVEETAAV